ncbi:hypothetical protein [Salmonella sp. s51933]|uniref:hypothetical protein n=1 Tax=Salmonella sp. s51933 TaxID=3160127 RepID=UPI0037542522
MLSLHRVLQVLLVNKVFLVATENRVVMARTVTVVVEDHREVGVNQVIKVQVGYLDDKDMWDGTDEKE